MNLLLEAFEQRGVRLCDWKELERLMDEDPLRAAALSALAEAPTARTAAILLDQYQGAFGRAVDKILAALGGGDLEGAGCALVELGQYTAVARHLTTPWRVTVAGAPNVGKSSLVNALAGYQRSVVAPTPGTTRDVVTTLIALDGWPVELADTAGQRAEAETLEEAGIERAIAAAAAADLCLWVLDASVPPIRHDPAGPRAKIVVNKMDLPAAWDVTMAPDAVKVSAQTGEGLADLCRAVAGWLVPDAPPPGAAVPFTPELCDRIKEVRALLSTGQAAEAERLLGVLRRS
jgi:tRNA modification GTPase